MVSGAPSGLPPVAIPPALSEDLQVLGRLGALLMRMHHDLDAARFVPATPRTADGYAAWLRRQLSEPDALVA